MCGLLQWSSFQLSFSYELKIYTSFSLSIFVANSDLLANFSL